MTDIPYTLIRSQRKTLAIQITGDGRVVLRCPRRLPEKQARAFLEQKRDWIENKLRQQQNTPQLPPFAPEELQALARALQPELARRLADFSLRVGVAYGRVAIRSQRSRWGSCSSKGNLNFNCLLALAPSWVLDYVVVHELCHLKHMDHSPQFWAEVARVLPDYDAARRWLKTDGAALIRRL